MSFFVKTDSRFFSIWIFYNIGFYIAILSNTQFFVDKLYFLKSFANDYKIILKFPSLDWTILSNSYLCANSTSGMLICGCINYQYNSVIYSIWFLSNEFNAIRS
jgi:hypothetical protein